MIKRKIIYFVAITAILISPIMYWMNKWWGVEIFAVPSFGVLKYVLSQDKFLLTVTGINLVLYLIAIIKIFTMKDSKESGKSSDNGNKKDGESLNFLNNISKDDISKWENLYGNSAGQIKKDADVKIQKEKDNQTTVNQNSTDINNLSFKPPESPVNTSVGTAATQNNIVDIPNSVGVNDVYRNMIHDVLIDYGYENLGNRKVAGINVDFVSIAESDTLLIGIITPENHDIIANETLNNGEEVPSWFSSEQKFDSPVWEIKNVHNMLKKMIDEVLPEDNGIIIKPIVVVPNANISNYDEIKSKWEEIGVDVVRFMNHSDLPSLTEVIPDRKDTEVLESYKNFKVHTKK